VEQVEQETLLDKTHQALQLIIQVNLEDQVVVVDTRVVLQD
jgi:hypothetical protein